MSDIDPAEIVAEAVREYVGDGDGADEEVLASYEQQVRASPSAVLPDIIQQAKAEAWDEALDEVSASYTIPIPDNPYREDAQS